ncbi:hypothetical protein BANRA_05492 [Escherichia coli]|uniref:Uncharacterized protein n=1 Tax=Escherichia coli TaxID=562 RepID=A0A3P5HD36_ECOLX|nr:hypothetical protein BANRA_05492 [Escherichia coli]
MPGLIALLIWGRAWPPPILVPGDLWPVKEPDMLTVIAAPDGTGAVR